MCNDPDCIQCRIERALIEAVARKLDAEIMGAVPINAIPDTVGLRSLAEVNALLDSMNIRHGE